MEEPHAVLPTWPFAKGHSSCSACFGWYLSSDDIEGTLGDLKQTCPACALLKSIAGSYSGYNDPKCSFRLSLRAPFLQLSLFYLHRANISGIDLFTESNKLKLEITTDPTSHHDTRVPLEYFPVGDTGSVQALAWVKDRISECSTDHEHCIRKFVTYLPRRILKIIDASTVRLHVPAPDYCAPYSCLSHCWGNEQPLVTTTANLEQRKNGIDWDRLPKTFQHAITFVRSLGLEYIWIDSLCIIQDDLDDWRREGSNMASIYENSYLTVAATWAANASEGLFSQSSQTYCYRVFGFADSERKVLVRERPADPIVPLWHRAWTFQELLLAPRVVYFTTHETMWECKSTVRQCEYSGPEMAKGTYTYGPKSSLWGSWDIMWRSLVSSYSDRQLTYESDAFPALQGLAYLFLNRRKCAYLAGLWEDSLVEDLVWSTGRIRTEGVYTPSQWRAPSWSWASVLGKVHWPLQFQGDRTCVYARATATTEPEGSDPLGQLKAGTLWLTAHCMELIIEPRHFLGGKVNSDSSDPTGLDLSDLWCGCGTTQDNNGKCRRHRISQQAHRHEQSEPLSLSQICHTYADLDGLNWRPDTDMSSDTAIFSGGWKDATIEQLEKFVFSSGGQEEEYPVPAQLAIILSHHPSEKSKAILYCLVFRTVENDPDLYRRVGCLYFDYSTEVEQTVATQLLEDTLERTLTVI